MPATDSNLIFSHSSARYSVSQVPLPPPATAVGVRSTGTHVSAGHLRNAVCFYLYNSPCLWEGSPQTWEMLYWHATLSQIALSGSVHGHCTAVHRCSAELAAHAFDHVFGRVVIERHLRQGFAVARAMLTRSIPHFTLLA